MEKTFRVTALVDDYYSDTADVLSHLIETRPYPFTLTIAEDITDIDLSTTDVFVDITSNESVDALYESLIASKVLIVSSNSKLLSQGAGYLSDLAKSLEAKLYLNSIFSGNDKYKLLNLNEKNIKNYSPEEILGSKSDDSTKLANSIYQDITRAHNKWDPSFEQARRNREIQRKLETKQNLYEVAKSLNVELEAQPCGIDPKLPDVEGRNE